MKCVGLKRRLDFGQIFIGLYVLVFLIYLAVGFLPVNATKHIDDALQIPKIDLSSAVVEVALDETGSLPTPDQIVGSYAPNKNKTFLFGHSATVFGDLHQISLDDVIVYRGQTYHVYQKDLMLKNTIKMSELLEEAPKDTLVIMTCAGVLYENGDASHRVIIYAAA